jgi:GntR family transcriptional regulator
MAQAWREDQPIWKQIKDRVVEAILDGGMTEGDALPSVRQVAADMSVNPLTVSRAYQELADDGVVEKRRGLGMYVVDGARTALGAREREAFLRDEWPVVLDRIRRLGLTPADLLDRANGQGPGTNGKIGGGQ